MLHLAVVRSIHSNHSDSPFHVHDHFFNFKISFENEYFLELFFCFKINLSFIRNFLFQLRKQMIDGKTGSETFSTFVMSSDEVRMQKHLVNDDCLLMRSGACKEQNIVNLRGRLFERWQHSFTIKLCCY